MDSLSTPSPAWEQKKAAALRAMWAALERLHRVLSGPEIQQIEMAVSSALGAVEDAARAADASQIQGAQEEIAVLRKALGERNQEVAALSAQVERHANQARDISTWLSEAGCPAMPIPEGVKWLLHRAEAAEDQVAQLTQEKDELRARMAKWPDTWRRAAALSGKAGTPAYIDAAHAYEVCADDIDGELAQLRQQREIEMSEVVDEQRKPGANCSTHGHLWGHRNVCIFLWD